MIVSAMGLNQATANGTYTLFGGADAGHQTDKHIGMETWQQTQVDDLRCACACLFDDPAMTQAPGVYKPEHEEFTSDDGSGPITSTEVLPDAKENCYTYKPTTMGKSSKGTKTTKGPSAKSAKGSKRV
eukprot:scaffold150393_cov55-Cyclotella_meneghiniana.AAC.2